VREIRAKLFICLLLIGIATGICLFKTSGSVSAAVPYKMNYQGKLTNASGNSMANGTYNMRFRIYDTPTGGVVLWSEDRLVSAGHGITINNGMFSTKLGDVTSLPSSLFANGALHFEVELPTPATVTSSSPLWSEGAMSPRSELASSAYAFNSDLLDGLNSSDFGQIGASNTFTGANNFKNSVDTTSAFSIQDASGSSLFKADTTNNNIVIGELVSDANAVFLVVDGYNQAIDPAGGLNGAIYYNSSLAKLRCYENNTWKDCIASTGSGSTTVKMSSNVINSSVVANTLVDATGLQFTATAGVTYRFNAFIDYSSAATTTGSRWTVTGPASPTQFSLRSTYTLSATSGTTIYAGAYNIPAASNASSLTSANIAVLEGRITTSTTGIVKIQFASEIASSAITARAGSSLTYYVE
jgi:hypothetical protein